MKKIFTEELKKVFGGGENFCRGVGEYGCDVVRKSDDFLITRVCFAGESEFKINSQLMITKNENRASRDQNWNILVECDPIAHVEVL